MDSVGDQLESGECVVDGFPVLACGGWVMHTWILRLPVGWWQYPIGKTFERVDLDTTKGVGLDTTKGVGKDTTVPP